MSEEELYPTVAQWAVPAIPDLNDKVTSNQHEVVSTLADQVDKMIVDPGQEVQRQEPWMGKDASLPIIQFPDEGEEAVDHRQESYVRLGMTADMFAQVQALQVQTDVASKGSSRATGSRPSDMIPAMQGLSDLHVSFGSMSEVSMSAADTILGKRTAEE
jgi:hypothetical protein